jgi:2-polyprenyl-3-methyl-5-hydroxy-6-metoxy-1,4-benzoquinol methylase
MIQNNKMTQEQLEDCKNHWYAYIYEQQVIQADEVAYILDSIGSARLRILEVACGGGRILTPLAEVGHNVTGFDADEAMLERCKLKINPYSNARCYRADAVHQDWGEDYDVVVLAGNILVNIISDIDNTQAQVLFIQRAAQALKSGGHLYLDFGCHDWPALSPGVKWERIIFEGRTTEALTVNLFLSVTAIATATHRKHAMTTAADAMR